MRGCFRFFLFGSLIVACSSGERNKTVPAIGSAQQTLETLRTYPEIASRISGLPLTRDERGIVAKTIDGTRPLGPAFVDTRELPTGFRAVLPVRAGGAVRIAISETIYLDVIADGDHAVAGTIADGAVVYGGARVGVDVVLSASRDHVEEVRLIRASGAQRVLRYRLKKGPGIARLRLIDGVVEALDGNGVARLRSDRWFAVDANHRHVDLQPTLQDDVLTATLGEDLAYPVAVDPGWGPTTTLAIARKTFTLTALPDGKLLAAGGQVTGGGATSSAEIFDPATRSWTLAKPMNIARSRHAAALLSSGKVLVVGSFGAGVPCANGSTTELYDPGTDTWTASGAMAIPRGDVGLAILSPSGRVFVGAGRTCGGPTDPSNTAEVYDPSTGTFTSVTGTMSGQHGAPVAAAFGTNKAVLAGGWPGYGTTSYAEIYDGASNTWSSTPKMTVDRGDLGPSVTLGDGRVLVFGGSYFSGSFVGHTSAEAFLPSAGAFSAIAPMPSARRFALSIRLTTGKVLVSHGDLGSAASYAQNSTAALYDPTANSWTNAGNVATLRVEGAIAALPGGAALAVGGANSTSSYLSSAEIWADAVATGGSCVTGAQCSGGFCADGVCCDRACTGACEACAETGSVGTCTLVTGAPRGTRTACTGTGACGGTCDGTSVSCTYASSAVSCVTGTCIGGVENGPAYCNGAGACGTAPTPKTCAPYACGTIACKTTCAAASDCDAASYCDATNKCVTKKKQADPCVAAAECVTGSCADGVCCDTACEGACMSCNVSGSVGVCTATACEDAGVTMDAAPETSVAVDAGADAIAETPAPNWGATPKVESAFQKCTKNSECSTGFCVEGVCCDTACADRCHSCALLTSPGKCTLEPIGVDLKNECGAALSCVGTCGPAGECVGAGQGTMCGRNRCTSASTGVGPAYCPGPGGKCGTEEAVPFDCGAYVCEPAFGACVNACSSSADCARGYTCDVPSKTCVAIAPPAEEEGCAVSSVGRAGSLGALVMMLAGMMASRARKRVVQGH